MSKRGVTFTKPQEPSFIRKLKEQIGYKEGPTVETKKEQLEPDTQEDREDNPEEQPTVVVLQPGDLSAEEAVRLKEQLKKDAEETPADLNAPIVFKASSSQKSTKRAASETEKKKSPKKPKNKPLLSFNDDEEENDDN